MVQSECWSLQAGQRFAFEQYGQMHEVVETGIIDREGNDLVLYRASDGLRGHYRDHTPVWVM